MDNCYILKADNFSEFYGYESFLKFKYQRIFRPNLEIDNEYSAYGIEVLLDAKKMVHLGVSKYDLENIICYGEAANKSLDFTLFFNHYQAIFINIERANLCDVRILRRIVDTSRQLRASNIELVVEVTERDPCKNCSRIIEGLKYLSSMQVSLACDDFDYVCLDTEYAFKRIAKYFNYIKVDIPNNKFEKIRFDLFMELYGENKKIIIEKVESNSQLKLLENKPIWGIQGFLFCEGCSFPILQADN